MFVCSSFGGWGVGGGGQLWRAVDISADSLLAWSTHERSCYFWGS